MLVGCRLWEWLDPFDPMDLPVLIICSFYCIMILWASAASFACRSAFDPLFLAEPWRIDLSIGLISCSPAPTDSYFKLVEDPAPDSLSSCPRIAGLPIFELEGALKLFFFDRILGETSRTGGFGYCCF